MSFNTVLSHPKAWTRPNVKVGHDMARQSFLVYNIPDQISVTVTSKRWLTT